ncbi:quinol:cytochrome C oxidoreductase [Flavobacteriales bacterium]|nr:quinol:cytochrome C oxidoreductase [Flavobacteriales bacterium]
MLIGLIALIYGFISADRNSYSDKEIKKIVKELYKEKDNQKSELLKYENNDNHHSTDKHHTKENSEDYHYAALFSKIEKHFNCHLDYDQKKNAHSLDDVIYVTKHYFHTIKQRPWSSLIVSNLFFLMISLAALVWLAVQYISQSGWSASLLRIPQAVSTFLPYGGVIMLFIIITGAMHWHHTYHWMDESLTSEYVVSDSVDSDHPKYTNEKSDDVVLNKKFDYIIAGKTAYLNIPFFIIRAFIYLLGWCLMAYFLRKFSIKEDIEGGLKWHNKMFTLSAIFIVFAAITTSMGAWDWIMSIDTHWFSTLFGWYSFASVFVSSCAVLAIITIHLKYKGYLNDVNENHMHDFGRYLLAFSIFWTYLWFAQYMLIWYSNIPEEVTYYMIRFDHYHILIITALILNFVSPMLLIQDRAAKRLKGQVLFVAILILIGHYIDVFVMIMPGTVGTHWHLGFVEIGVFLGYIGFFTYIVLSNLSKVALQPKNHPMLIESKHHHI